MKITGSSVLHATPALVWSAITDPVVLAGVIPGCDELTAIGENHFAMTVTLGVAAIKGTYTGEVRLVDLVEPGSLTMKAFGAGGPGTIDTAVDVRLTDNADGTTTLDYEADATVGGMAGGVGQRVLSSVAKKTAGLFFAAIDDVLTGARTIGPHDVRTLTGEPPSIQPLAAAPTGRYPRTPSPWPIPSPAGLVAASLAGAVTMLVGVLVGVRIARHR